MDVAFGDDKVDQRDLLFQSVARLEHTARKAEESGQLAVVVGCVAQLNKMMALGADQKGFPRPPDALLPALTVVIRLRLSNQLRRLPSPWRLPWLGPHPQGAVCARPQSFRSSRRH